MPSDNDLIDIYEQLMAISRNMLQSRHYEVAFHALQAALHCAEDLHDEQRLVAVQQEAQSQIDTIDSTDPQHRMSTQESLQRGGQSLYALLLRQVSLIISQVEREHRQKPLGLPDLKNI